MFGEESVPKLLHGDKIYVSVDNKKAFIDLTQFKVKINIYLLQARIYQSELTNLPVKCSSPELFYSFFPIYFPYIKKHFLFCYRFVL